MSHIHHVSSPEGGARRGRNIRSIRSVMMNPLTAFVLEANTAIAPSTVASVPWPPPASSNDPTNEIAEMAFVSDISGVCNRPGTLVITVNPRNDASTKT